LEDEGKDVAADEDDRVGSWCEPRILRVMHYYDSSKTQVDGRGQKNRCYGQTDEISAMQKVSGWSGD